MEQHVREKRIWIAICLQAVIIAVCVIGMLVHGNKTVNYSVPLEFSLDETMEAGIYEIVPAGELFLPKGHYLCRLSYHGGSEESYLLPSFSGTEYFCDIQANILLREGLTAGEDEFWLDADTEPSISVVYSGSGRISVERLDIEQTLAPDRMRLFGILFVFLAVDIICFMVKKKGNPLGSVQNKAIAVGLLLLVLLTSYPLTLGYPIAGDDMDFHLGRIEGMAESFREGQIPQRINSVFFEGYGYANPVFYGELLLTFPAVMRVIGFRLTTCYMALVFLINALTCILSCYCFSKILKKKEIGLAAAYFYCLAPYRLVDVYSRAAVGEYSAMAFLPLVFLGMYRIYACDTDESDYKKSFIPLLIGLTGIMQSHTLTGEMTAAFLILACVVFWKRTFQKKRFCELLKAAGGTILVNAWFLVPFLDYSLTVPVKSLQSSNFRPIQDHGAFWAQIIGLFVSSLRNTAPPSQGIVGEMPFTVGTPLVLGQFLCIFMLSARKQLAERGGEANGSGAAGTDSSSMGRRYAGCGFFALAMAFLASWMSTVHFPWDALVRRIPVLALPVTSLQYPWRLLSMAVLFASVAAGIGLGFLKENLEKYYVPALATLLALTVICGMFMMQTPMQTNYPYTSNNLKKLDSCVAGGYEEYLLLESERLSIHNRLGVEVTGGVRVLDYQKKGCAAWLDVDAAGGGGSVILPLLAYKGYRCELMEPGQPGQASETERSSKEGSPVAAFSGKEALGRWEDGRIMVSLEAGQKGRLRVYFREPITWRVAEIISLVSVIMIYLRCRKRRTG